MITDAIVLGSMGGNVEDGLAFGAGAASGEAGDDFIEWKFVVDDGAEWEIFFIEKIVERAGLRECTRETVEEETALAAEARGAFADHVPNGGVGDKRTAAHKIEGGKHGGRGRAISASMGGTEDIASGEMAGAELFMNELGLRPLAYAGGAEKNETPELSWFGGDGGTCDGRAVKPGSAIGLLRGHGKPLVMKNLAEASVRKGANPA
jgi:hypothetical protein